MKAAVQALPAIDRCPCDKPRARVITHPGARNIISVRCDNCGRQGLGGLSEGMALRNWRELLKDGVS